MFMQSFSIKLPTYVLDEIIDYSKEAFPREFFAFLEGKRRIDLVIIENLAYYPNVTSRTSVTTIFHIGTNMNDFVGTVHSHPSGNNLPSRNDLRTFNKRGVIHFIIRHPFTKESIRCFGSNGQELDFEVI